MKKLIITLTATLTLGSGAFAQDDNLFPEGNFEGEIQLDASHPMPKHLQKQAGVFYIEPGDYQQKGAEVVVTNEQGANFLRFMTPSTYQGNLRTYIALDLPSPPPAALTIALRWRSSGLNPQDGAPNWASAQCDPVFVFEDGQEKTIFNTLRLKDGTNGEWIEVEKTVTVPDGAKRLILQPGLYQVNGTLDVDDIKIFAE